MSIATSIRSSIANIFTWLSGKFHTNFAFRVAVKFYWEWFSLHSFTEPSKELLPGGNGEE